MTQLDYLRYMSPALLVASGALGLLLGGHWVWLGFGAFLLVAAIDPLLGKDHGMRRSAHPRLADVILYFQVVPVALLWVAFAWRIGHANAGLTSLDYFGAAVSVAFMTAIGGLPAAHEMFHRHSALGKFVGSVLGTIFASGYSSLAHVHVHHIETDTPDDTETPRRGESVYHFVLRAAYRQHRRSWQIEMARLRKLDLGFWSPRNLVLRGIAMYAVLLGGFYLATGLTGMLLLMLVSALGLFILEIFSYIQHYGLLREPGTPIEDRHAWNHLTPLGRALTFEIVTHSEHHVDPDRPYWRLTPRPNAPQMPSAVTCFVLALIPPLWERLIGRPLLQHWDAHHASARERELAIAANRAAGWPDWLSHEAAVSAA